MASAPPVRLDTSLPPSDSNRRLDLVDSPTPHRVAQPPSPSSNRGIVGWISKTLSLSPSFSKVETTEEEARGSDEDYSDDEEEEEDEDEDDGARTGTGSVTPSAATPVGANYPNGGDRGVLGGDSGSGWVAEPEGDDVPTRLPGGGSPGLGTPTRPWRPTLPNSSTQSVPSSNTPTTRTARARTLSTSTHPHPPPTPATETTLLSFLPSISLPSISLPSLLTSFNLHSLLPRIPNLTWMSDDDPPNRSGSARGHDFKVGEAVGGGVGEESAGVGSRTSMSMDLQIDQATANGETFEDRATASETPAATPQRPGFPALNRTPSSAFVAASGSGRVNPLTMQAIARKGSEDAALRVYREREERERKWSAEDGSGSGGAGNRPPIARKASWTAAASSVLGGRDSPPGSGGRRAANGADGSRGLREREISAGSSVGSTSNSTRPRPRDPSDALPSPSSSSSASPASPIPRLFSSNNNILPRPLSAVSEAPSVRSHKSSIFKRWGRHRNKSVVSGVESEDSRSPTPLASPSPSEAPRVDKGKEKERPRYIKVKSKGKSHKDFNTLFLAQELFIASPSHVNNDSIYASSPSDDRSMHSAAGSGAPESSNAHDDASMHSHSEPAPGSTSGSGRKKNAVWAIKFSLDGKYLAVGGKDGVVRVWEVLSNAADRLAALNPEAVETERSDASPQTPSKKKTPPRVPVATMPVFGTHPIQEWRGHEADVLDLSWSKNNFLLSSSMDKTVRLWHVSRAECLCAFQHLDFVTSIAFHPKDDRFFLSGSLDCKLRLWNIPEKRVHVWTELPELITSVAFTSDGKLAIAGSFVGVCMFFEVSNFHYHAQFAAKSSRGKNSKGRKITSMVSMPIPSSGGERLLVTSNDSRMRLYHLADKTVEMKYSGHENLSSQIRASFSDDAHFIISGSEDRHVYIWDSGLLPQSDGSPHFHKKKDGAGYEYFQMSANIITCATFAPTLTRAVLAHSEDPIFSNNHVHLAPLRETLSGVPLSAFPTGASTRLIPVTSADSHTAISEAEDSIIVVVDDATGVISVFRNSVVPVDGGGKLGKRRSSKAPSEG